MDVELGVQCSGSTLLLELRELLNKMFNSWIDLVAAVGKSITGGMMCSHREFDACLISVVQLREVVGTLCCCSFKGTVYCKIKTFFLLLSSFSPALLSYLHETRSVDHLV